MIRLLISFSFLGFLLSGRNLIFYLPIQFRYQYIPGFDAHIEGYPPPAGLQVFLDGPVKRPLPQKRCRIPFQTEFLCFNAQFQ